MIAKACCWMILLLLVPNAAFAQGADDAALRELYLKSGMQKQVEQFPRVIQAGFDQAAARDPEIQKLPANLVAAMKALAPEAFAPKTIKSVILAEMKAKLTASDAKDVLKWLDSPLGKKLARFEEAASTPEGYKATQQYMAQLQSAPPSPRRLEFIRKLDSAAKGTENAIAIAMQTEIAITLAVIATFPLEQQRPLDDVAREMEKNKPAIEADVKTQTLLSFLYAYRSVTEEEIQRYVDFLTSPAGSKFQSAATAALKKASLESSVKWGKAIGETLKQMQGQSQT